MVQPAAQGNRLRTVSSARTKVVALALFAMMAAASVTSVASASQASDIENAGARIASVSLVDGSNQDVASIIMAWPKKYEYLGY